MNEDDLKKIIAATDMDKIKKEIDETIGDKSESEVLFEEAVNLTDFGILEKAGETLDIASYQLTSHYKKMLDKVLDPSRPNLEYDPFVYTAIKNMLQEAKYCKQPCSECLHRLHCTVIAMILHDRERAGKQSHYIQ